MATPEQQNAAQGDEAKVEAFAAELMKLPPAGRVETIARAVQDKSPELVALNAIIDAKRVRHSQVISDTPYPDPHANSLSDAARTVRYEVLRWLLSASLQGTAPAATGNYATNPYAALHTDGFKVDFLVKDLYSEKVHLQMLYQRHMARGYQEITHVRHLYDVLQTSNGDFRNIIGGCLDYLSTNSVRYAYESEQYLRPILSAIAMTGPTLHNSGQLSTEELAQLQEVTAHDPSLMDIARANEERNAVRAALAEYCATHYGAVLTLDKLDTHAAAVIRPQVDAARVEALRAAPLTEETAKAAVADFMRCPGDNLFTSIRDRLAAGDTSEHLAKAADLVVEAANAMETEVLAHILAAGDGAEPAGDDALFAEAAE